MLGGTGGCARHDVGTCDKVIVGGNWLGFIPEGAFSSLLISSSLQTPLSFFSHSFNFFIASTFFCVYLCRDYTNKLHSFYDSTSV